MASQTPTSRLGTPKLIFEQNICVRIWRCKQLTRCVKCQTSVSKQTSNTSRVGSFEEIYVLSWEQKETGRRSLQQTHWDMLVLAVVTQRQVAEQLKTSDLICRPKSLEVAETKATDL